MKISSQNFCNDIPAEIRENSFSLLLEEDSGPVTLVEAEKDRLKAEYSTLYLNAQDIIKEKKSQSGTPENLWYTLLLKENTTNIACLLTILHYGFSRNPLDECVVEVQVSTISSIDNPHFKGKPWQFVLSNIKYYVSHVWLIGC